MFKSLSLMTSLVKDAHRIPEVAKRSHEKLRNEVLVAEAGGGAIRIAVNGLGEAQQVELAPALLRAGSAEGAEQLLLEALQQVNRLTRQRLADSMQQASQELNLNLPGVNELLAQFTGGSTP